ncbi:hypothetical protein HNR00_003522 [Methylorubrum rhodinum]|uniref:Uncharacterized protein n=1 Tax=Methylorubrum rhodinum TaxID=29428 RepID=A0A840ZP35_9HYPH|nr:hypothetical protein [Methylorubrum rhodinum]MBB5758795.1 hypothetical protein [Methylorubrum rhodinum]
MRRLTGGQRLHQIKRKAELISQRQMRNWQAGRLPWLPCSGDTERDAIIAEFDRMDANLAQHLEEHARFRASANEMWEQCKFYGGQMLANKRRYEEAEAKVAELKALCAALKEQEARDGR